MLDLNYFTEEEARAIGLDEIVEGDKECYPEAFSYILARLEATSEKDLVVLKVHPDNRLKDRSGWDLKSYFPNNEEPIMVWEKIETGPYLVEVKFRGYTLMGLQDACPMIMYANRKYFKDEEKNILAESKNFLEAVVV